jgi:hypothetical protein
MKLFRVAPFIVTPIVLLAAFSCESGGVGDPCIPEDEYDPAFPGFDEKENNAESRSFQCETRVCLVNNFRGRVSCPYGQNDPNGDPVAGVDPTADTCTTPDGTFPVAAPVNPQLIARRPGNSVYCSCRCNGSDPNARYCECPEGFDCREVLPDLGLGKEQLAGGYCVRSGSFVQNPDRDIDQTPCNWNDKDCGDSNTAEY